ncbi:hypothetical protein L1D34_24665 [Vibrio mediterranei]|uniref:hypothetical protein n=1 Tax=Vibrio mediterranei TaxID=689 RepID=UPI001EFDCD77|nr:hypothetical protein [Vibrio mediterranei]MCG9628020.1 hypothetical protein [Vibrio mediterranei]
MINTLHTKPKKPPVKTIWLFLLNYIVIDRVFFLPLICLSFPPMIITGYTIELKIRISLRYNNKNAIGYENDIDSHLIVSDNDSV